MTDNQKKAQFMLMYRPIHENLSRYCASLCGNEDNAKDLMSDTVLIAFEKFDDKKITNFKAYMFGIASNLFKKSLRRNKFKGEISDTQLEREQDFGQNPEAYTDFELLKVYLQLLKPELREVFILHEINGFKLAEIAKIQNTSLSNVKQRAKRARDKMLEIMQLSSQTNKTVNHLKVAKQ